MVSMVNATAAPRARVAESGFTVIEIMIALTVLLIGIAGILSLQMSGLRASGYSRHAAEAAVVAEDKMEILLLAPATSVVSGTDTVNELGIPDADGRYIRTWTVTAVSSIATVEVEVEWFERGSESHKIRVHTQRALD